MSLLIDLVSRCHSASCAAPQDFGTDNATGGQAERGASLVEYALLVAMIAVVCLGAVTFFGTEITDSLSTSGGSIAN